MGKDQIVGLHCQLTSLLWGPYTLHPRNTTDTLNNDENTLSFYKENILSLHSNKSYSSMSTQSTRLIHTDF